MKNLGQIINPKDVTTKEYVDNGLSNKVNTEVGKGLSANDYTTVEKNKLNGVEEQAEVNLIEKINVNGITQEINNKIVNISFGTDFLKSDTVSNIWTGSQAEYDLIENKLNTTLYFITG